jgi:hypothetical protein
MARGKVFARLGNRLKPGMWLLTQLYRYYVPAPPAKADRVIAFVPFLDPPDGYDQPVCAAYGLRFPKAVGPGVYVKKRGQLRTILGKLAGRTGGVDYQSIGAGFPQADRTDVWIIPLCDLTSDGDVVEKLVRPALRLQAVAGS